MGKYVRPKLKPETVERLEEASIGTCETSIGGMIDWIITENDASRAIIEKQQQTELTHFAQHGAIKKQVAKLKKENQFLASCLAASITVSAILLGFLGNLQGWV